MDYHVRISVEYSIIMFAEVLSTLHLTCGMQFNSLGRFLLVRCCACEHT